MSHSLVVEPRSESRQFAVRVHFFNQYQYFISFDCDPQEKKKNLLSHHDPARSSQAQTRSSTTYLHPYCLHFIWIFSVSFHWENKCKLQCTKLFSCPACSLEHFALTLFCLCRNLRDLNFTVPHAASPIARPASSS